MTGDQGSGRKLGQRKTEVANKHHTMRGKEFKGFEGMRRFKEDSRWRR
jgi:hypothetical protein